MLAKDEPTHPINEISGKMAILSSADILIKMDRFIKGYNYTAKEIIHDIIIHPLHTDYFDRLVIDFVNANPLKIFNSCTYSNQLEGIRVATCKSQTGIDRIINIGEEANNDYDINQFSNPYQGSEDGEEFSLKEFVEQEVQIEPLVETQKELNDELVKQLQSYAEGNKCRELDENTFVEFMKCYYYDITKEDEEELKKIWRKYAKHYFLWFIKQDKLSNSLDFSYHAYKVAVSYLDKRPKPGPFENFNQELNCNININQITE